MERFSTLNPTALLNEARIWLAILCGRWQGQPLIKILPFLSLNLDTTEMFTRVMVPLLSKLKDTQFSYGI